MKRELWRPDRVGLWKTEGKAEFSVYLRIQPGGAGSVKYNRYLSDELRKEGGSTRKEDQGIITVIRIW